MPSPSGSRAASPGLAQEASPQDSAQLDPSTSSSANPSTPPPPTPDDDDRSCFICLLTPAEDPDAVWVTPCPCTLTAHQSCMLRWIAEAEEAGYQTEGRRQRNAGSSAVKKIRCPACHGRIYTVEPRDRLLSLGDRYVMAYRRLTPSILLAFVSSMGLAGSTYYGFRALLNVAGYGKTISWLAGGGPGSRSPFASVSAISPFSPFYPPTSPELSPLDGVRLFGKVLLLSLVAPGLLLQRALPMLANVIALPASLLYGASLIARRRTPTWPPSPGWAIAALPSISIAYSLLYYDIFGRTERRLNQALRGRLPETENNNQEGQPQPNGAVQDGAAANGAVPAVALPEAPAPLLLSYLQRIGAAIANVVRHDNGAIMGNIEEAAAVFREEQLEFQLEVVVEEHREVDVDRDGHHFHHHHDHDHDHDHDHGHEDDEDDDAAVPPDIRRQPVEAAPVVVDAAPAGGAGAAEEQADGVGVSLSDVVSASASQLLLPTISGYMGDMLFLVLPSAWVLPTRITGVAGIPGKGGLLKERWGRSLVGGALFIVLRDLLRLYGKYRRVQVKSQRTIKNFDRRKRRRREPAGQTEQAGQTEPEQREEQA